MEQHLSWHGTAWFFVPPKRVDSIIDPIKLCYNSHGADLSKVTPNECTWRCSRTPTAMAAR